MRENKSGIQFNKRKRRAARAIKKFNATTIYKIRHMYQEKVQPLDKIVRPLHDPKKSNARRFADRTIERELKKVKK